MNRIHSPNIRFSGGYRTVPGKTPNDMQAQIFEAGYQHSKQAPTVEIIRPGENEVSQIPMQRKDGYWVSDALPLGTAYRTTLPGHSAPTLDWVEKTSHPDKGDFNVISPLEKNVPQKPTVIADTFLDSVLSLDQMIRLINDGKPVPELEGASKEKKAEYIRANSDKLPMRNHFNQFGGNQKGLQALLPTFQKMGISSILLKPFIGGDNLSSHRYWTVDPYVLNSSFTNKEQFGKFLDDSLRYGMKLFNDGAFVNQGLEGVQFLANRVYGKQSPYWDWFITEQTGQNGRSKLPRLAHEGMTLGVLPTKLSKDGHRVLDYDHINFDVVNDPEKDGYKKAQPTYIKVFNAAAPNGKSTYKIANSEDSMQPQFLQVEPKTLKKMRQAIGKALPENGDNAAKRTFLQVGNVRLASAAQDDSLYKWNGQIDVAKINIHNPEVVEYVRRSLEYWTRYVSNHMTSTVAHALIDAQEANRNASPTELIQKITGKNKTLPPILEANQFTDRFTDADVQAALKNLSQCDAGDVAKNMASGLLKEFPLMALELPTLFKATLSYPGLSDRLTGHTQGWQNFPRRILASLPLIGKYFQPFEKTLAKKLDKVMVELDKLSASTDSQNSPPKNSAKEKLRSEKVRSLVYEQLGRDLLMEVFTGIKPDAFDKPEKPSPIEIKDKLYETIPGSITKAAPQTAARLLPKFMKRRLNSIKPEDIAKRLNTQLKNLDPELVEVAAAVLNKREFGLNWRLDAAKDFGDIDRILNTRKSERPKLFQQEMAFTRKIWSEMVGSIKNIFPNSTIIAELTDFETLAGDDKVAQQEMSKFFNEGIITSTPDMRYLYSPLLQVINYAQRPDEFGDSQIKPAQFLTNAVQDPAQAYPAPANRHKQLMGASHDFMTVSHALLLNTNLWTMDHVKWLGLRDDLREAVYELQKPCFAPLKEQIPELGTVLKTLQGKVESLDDIAKKLPPSYQPYFAEWTKKHPEGMLPALYRCSPDSINKMFQVIKPSSLGLGDASAEEFKQALLKKEQPELSDSWKTFDNLKNQVEDAGIRRQLPREVILAVESFGDDGPNFVATPQELKAPFVDEAFKYGKLDAGLELKPKQLEALKQALRSRMSEASEAKAMRGVITNTLAKPEFWTSYELSDEQVKELQKNLWQALDAAILQWGRHFGHQPLDVAIENVFKRLDDKAWTAALPGQNAEQLKQKIKLELYLQANAPIKDKLLRIAAIQAAIPGSPSIYLPDAFMQSGGEWLKNFSVQDRNLIRLDRLEDERTALKDFQKKWGEINALREKLPALNNGHPQALTPDNESVLPIVRDNGHQQVIMLVNTGKPKGFEQGKPKVGSDAEYPEVEVQTPTVKDYTPNISELHMPEGTHYQDVNSKEYFVVDKNGQLVNAKTGKGMDIRIFRALERKEPSRVSRFA